MGQLGVRTDKARERGSADTELITPYGTRITVTAERAKGLLARTPIRFGDGVARKYVLPGEDNVVEPDTTSKATPPRKGDGRNGGE